MGNDSHRNEGLWIMISMEGTKPTNRLPTRSQGRGLRRTYGHKFQGKVHHRGTMIANIASFKALMVNGTVEEVLKTRWDQVNSNMSISRSKIKRAKVGENGPILPPSVEVTGDTRWRPKRRQMSSKFHRNK